MSRPGRLSPQMAVGENVKTVTPAGKDTQDDHRKQLAEKDLLIEQLRAENRVLKKERESFLKDLHLLLSRYGTQNE